VIDSDADWFGKVTDVALTVSETEAPEATIGALYTTDAVVIAESDPCAGGVQVTPAPVVSLRTVAEIGSAVPEPTIWGAKGFRSTAWNFAGVPVQPAFPKQTVISMQNKSENTARLAMATP
jgi:hypothetical protein